MKSNILVFVSILLISSCGDYKDVIKKIWPPDEPEGLFCDQKESQNQCSDYNKSSWSEKDAKKVCEDSNGTFNDKNDCSKTEVIGICSYKKSERPTTIYYYSPLSIDSVINKCNSLSGKLTDSQDRSIDHIDSDGDGFCKVGLNDSTLCKNNTKIDCNDSDANINPEATEVCDEVDNNCDTFIDEECAPVDHVGFFCNQTNQCSEYNVSSWNKENAKTNCLSLNGTFNDMNACSQKAILGICNYKKSGAPVKTYYYSPLSIDSMINKCSSLSGQLNDSQGQSIDRIDNDRDGFCKANFYNSTLCKNNTKIDCNDSDANINPDATEVCDEVDNNCNTAIDEGCTQVEPIGLFCNQRANQNQCSEYDDSFWGEESAKTHCLSLSGSFDNINPCPKDTTLAICTYNRSGKPVAIYYYPPLSVDTIIDRCNVMVGVLTDPNGKTLSDIDNDNDGFCKYGFEKSILCKHNDQVDCDDTNANIKPGADEICDNADNNCNGVSDEGCTQNTNGKFVHGKVPQDIELSTDESAIALLPKLLTGQRLSGKVTIVEKNNTKPPVPWRLLVDGVAQPSKEIDTTKWSKGSHVLSCQVTDNLGKRIRSGSRVVIFNNKDNAFTSLKGQAIVAEQFGNTKPHSSLAWGRVDVGAPVAYPLDPQLDMHPLATNDNERKRLSTEKIWWVEGLNHVPTPLWKTMPILMKNRDGDYFIKNFNPQGGGSGARSVPAFPYVQRAPAYDGPRGIGWLSPYTTLVANRHKVLASGQTGWFGVDLAGRVVEVDIYGNVKTILGPRSVTGVVGTDSDDKEVGMAERLASGEKEYIGSNNGKSLNLSQDIWVCDSFPFEGVIADTGNNRVVEINFDEQRLMRSWPIPDVSSVWGSLETQRKFIAWFAVNPEGLWNQVLQVDSSGKPKGHGVVKKIADIPGAFWVRLAGMRVFVMTLDRGIYEYSLDTGKVVERRPRDKKDDYFVFMAIDEQGSIGPKNRLYWSSTLDKTSIHWLDTNDWTKGLLSRNQLHNRTIYGNTVAENDAWGHYIWGFAPHATLPKALGCGITSSSWYMWTATLGEMPGKVPKLSSTAGRKFWKDGKLDAYLPPSIVWGRKGHGQIGFSVDQFRDYQTWETAKQPMLEALEPFFSPELSTDEREILGKQLFMQRTRKRFW